MKKRCSPFPLALNTLASHCEYDNVRSEERRTRILKWSRQLAPHWHILASLVREEVLWTPVMFYTSNYWETPPVSRSTRDAQSFNPFGGKRRGHQLLQKEQV